MSDEKKPVPKDTPAADAPQPTKSDFIRDIINEDNVAVPVSGGVLADLHYHTDDLLAQHRREVVERNDNLLPCVAGSARQVSA